MTDVVVVGAGLAGIACARALAAAGLGPVVLDKGRGIGGRMATRRVDLPAGPLRFDHGAQYVTARGPGFAEALGHAAPWDAAHPGARVGVPGMASLPRALAEGLDVRQRVEVIALHPDGPGWRLDTTAGEMRADAVVLTVPAPQVAALIGPDHPATRDLAGVRMVPCLTLMAAFPAAAPRPFATQASDTHPLAWIAQDSTKPERPATATAWVAQANPDWSAAHLEHDRDTLTALMLPLMADRLALDPSSALYSAAHRWRHARVTAPLGRPFLRHGRLWLGGDWCLGARAEDAWTSGTALARDLLEACDAR